jgi:Na+/H+ antiporter NhaD/arsenite permease-like protein
LDFIHRLLGAVVVIAANAGGAWTPIGDVTTTMLWIHGQISTLPTMKVFNIILKN